MIKSDLNGKTFGRLTVVAYEGWDYKKKSSMWTCSCVCGGQVSVRTCLLNSGGTKSCGCILVPPINVRFSANYIVVDSGCWEWQKAVSRGGYGAIRYENKQWSAHRLAYHLFKGTISAGALICHHCDNRKCVNPDHLYEGDYSTNNKDTWERKRHPKHFDCGEKNIFSKLSELDVKRIRSIKDPNTQMLQWLSACYGISLSYCYAIRGRRSWKHI